MRIDRAKMAAEMVRKDINGKKLAELTGLSRMTITAVRTGKSCAPKTAESIMSVLGEDILERDEICS